jgi:hypothetical protein
MHLLCIRSIGTELPDAPTLLWNCVESVSSTSGIIPLERFFNKRQVCN